MKNWNVDFDTIFLQKSMSGQAFLPAQGEEGIDKLKSFIKDLLSEQKREIVSKVEEQKAIHEQLSTEIIGVDHHEEYVRLLNLLINEIKL